MRSCWEHIQFCGTAHFCACLIKTKSLALAARLLARLPISWGIEVRRGWFIDTYGVDIEIGIRLDNILGSPAAVTEALLEEGGGGSTMIVLGAGWPVGTLPCPSL